MPGNAATMNTSKASIFSARQARLRQALEKAELRALVLNPGPSLIYLTGLHFHLMERPIVFILPVAGDPLLVLPELEQAKVEQLAFRAQPIFYNEEPSTWPAQFQQAAITAELSGARVGVEPGRLRFLELRLLEAAAPQACFLSAEDSLSELRMYKDEGELACMRKAVQIAQNALTSTLPVIRSGITERELAAELTLQLFRNGSDSEVPFTPIVSTGPNSANPHATPTDRRLAKGDLLVIDWGASYQGYISDITRTYAIDEVEAELQKIAALVEASNSAGRAAARPGITASAVDLAARAVIASAGYGEFFIHRTGHGIGMEGHEPPYIRQGNSMLLAPGMTFTVEPGIYLPGRGGVRIEDDVLITVDGVESLTDLPRQLQTIHLG